MSKQTSLHTNPCNPTCKTYEKTLKTSTLTVTWSTCSNVAFWPFLCQICQISFSSEFFYIHFSQKLTKFWILHSCVWYFWTCHRERFCKLLEAIWVTVINKTFKFPSQVDPCFQMYFLFKNIILGIQFYRKKNNKKLRHCL